MKINNKLNNLLKKYNNSENNFKMTDFIKDTYPLKDHKNKAAQISKILNPKKNAPKYYTEIDLSNDLANWFNKIKSEDDLLITQTYFLENEIEIKITGALYNDSIVDLYKTGVFKKILVNPIYADCFAILNKTRFSNGSIKIFKQSISESIYDNELCLAQDKKTKLIYYGFVEPISNSKYNILDISASTGKVVNKIIGNINLSWSSKQEVEINKSIVQYK